MKMLKLRDRMCIAPFTYATCFINNFKDNDGMPIIKVSYPLIQYDYGAFIFEKGSPFV